jgi:integrase
MPSVHKQKGKPYWFAYYNTRRDDGSLIRHTKSTHTKSKVQAFEIAAAWEKAARTAQAGILTPEAAREVIARGVADVFLASNREGMPKATTRQWIDRWLEAKELEAEPSTFTRYKGIVERFAGHLGAKAKRDVAALGVEDIARFRDNEAKERSRATANLSVKVLRICFGEAERRGLLTTNPAKRVSILKLSAERTHRRGFTLAELRRVLDTAGDSEMRGLILFGIYTGQRLGDVARLTWQQVDLEKGVARFIQKKTRHRLELPLARPLLDYLLTLSAPDDAALPVFPEAAAAAEKKIGTLSNRFSDLLADAGLVEARTHQAEKSGRNAKRQTSALSFHSLRHSAVSLLKASGATDAMAMAIAGHESAAISRHYTHLTADDLRATVDNLPDITKAAPAKAAK